MIDALKDAITKTVSNSNYQVKFTDDITVELIKPLRGGFGDYHSVEIPIRRIEDIGNLKEIVNAE